jgi:chorismate mutase / prephenate dehydratase
MLELLDRRRAMLAASGTWHPHAHDGRTLASMLPADGRWDSDSVAALLRHVDSLCAPPPQRQRASYLGPEFSYSHLAAIKYFGEASSLTPAATISAVFDAVLRGDVARGIVPIENSTDGRIVDTLSQLAAQSMSICGEVLLPIHHYLLGLGERSDVREVHSKPQALSQCRGWLAKHLPAARLVEVSSTTVAAQEAAQRPEIAAIASEEAGRRYALRVIDRCIEDNPDNVTRFAVIGSNDAPPSGDDKTSIVFRVPHRPGALSDALLIFRKAGLNLTWIESFPLRGQAGEYLFFIELEGHRDHPEVQAACAMLAKDALRLDVLGSYPRFRSLDEQS